MSARLPALLASLLLAAVAAAEPDLRSPRELGPLRVYPDHERKHVFYYAPGPLELASDADGRPALRFLQMRYVGTSTYGNAGETGSFSTLSLRVRMQETPAQELQRARRMLRKLAGRTQVELRPLPIRRLEAGLVYARIGQDGSPGERRRLPRGSFESEDAPDARSSPKGYWSERAWAVSLDPDTSQLLWQTLHSGHVLMSVSYAFASFGVVGEERVRVQTSGVSEDQVEGLLASLGLEELSREHLGSPDEGRGVQLASRLVRVGATEVRVDAERWPELFTRVDFNQQAPPGYAALRLYCYDFANALRPDLFYKKVEVEAETLGGQRVQVEAKFLGSQPELYSRTLRFPVAVFVDRPFRYRVTIASRDGSKQTGAWREGGQWGRILDVTTGALPDSGSSEEAG